MATCRVSFHLACSRYTFQMLFVLILQRTDETDTHSRPYFTICIASGNGSGQCDQKIVKNYQRGI